MSPNIPAQPSDASDQTNGTGQDADLSWLLEHLIASVPHARFAQLLSVDGLSKFYAGEATKYTEQFAAAAASMHSTARGIANLFGGRAMRQVIVDVEGFMLFIQPAHRGSVLAVMAGDQVDPTILGSEMNRLVSAVREAFATPNRQALPMRGD